MLSIANVGPVFFNLFCLAAPLMGYLIVGNHCLRLNRSQPLFLRGLLIILLALAFDIGNCNDTCFSSPSQQQQQQQPEEEVIVSSNEIGKQLKDWILRMKNPALEVSTFLEDEQDREFHPIHWIHSCTDEEDFAGTRHS